MAEPTTRGGRMDICLLGALVLALFAAIHLMVVYRVLWATVPQRRVLIRKEGIHLTERDVREQVRYEIDTWLDLIGFGYAILVIAWVLLVYAIQERILPLTDSSLGVVALVTLVVVSVMILRARIELHRALKPGSWPGERRRIAS